MIDAEGVFQLSVEIISIYGIERLLIGILHSVLISYLSNKSIINRINHAYASPTLNQEISTSAHRDRKFVPSTKEIG